MSPTRREVVFQLAALAALPLSFPRLDVFADVPSDPLGGTIAEFQAGRRRHLWTSAEMTAHALQRCRTDGKTWHAIDALSATAMADARASDARLRAGKLRGPLDGVPLFAKAIYDMNGLPTTGSSMEWADLFPEPVHRDALEVQRMRAAGAVVLGKTAADDFA
ncbi:MAG TPA: amidase family protein, partial [Gemmatimonadaceae bacterium]|nr:amidase family protein [Gemmatimonadaceae bacterium]